MLHAYVSGSSGSENMDEIRSCINCEYFEGNQCHNTPPFMNVEPTDWCKSFIIPQELAKKICDKAEEIRVLATKDFLAKVKQNGFE